jgi:arginine decarboxylase
MARITEAATSMRGWTVADSLELYNVKGWGRDFFAINDKGNVEVTPAGPAGGRIDMRELVEDLRRRGVNVPVLIRFSDILRSRVEQLCGAFHAAIAENAYKGVYRGVYPIKVNQQRHVVEELINFGRPYNLGVEAGSKPELLVALALLDNPEALILCNGYKDRAYIETALLAQKLGRRPVIIIDRFQELDTIIRCARELNIRPVLGVRGRLSTKGAGKWIESTGDRSKFGLTTAEIVETLERLRAEGMLDCLQLLHFHIGSQITAIRAIKDALREGSRLFVELHALGANMRYFDAGGGLGVDYDGSSTNFHSSVNYTMQEYAADVVAAIADACNKTGVPHPDVITESGRALTAHHSVIVFNVLGTNEVLLGQPPEASAGDEHAVIKNLYDVWAGLTRKNFQEGYHDALQIKEEAITAFNLGYLDLKARARAEQLFWAICEKILKIVRELPYVPDELDGLERSLSDSFYCNFSLFQSLPDHWAVKQLFPAMPIQKLGERPNRRAVLCDLTCDSDGKMDQFIDLRDVKHVLELHSWQPGEPYYIGIFLVGAYQEVLGDLHNLFGDIDAVHVSLDETGYHVEHVVEGDTVQEVLAYMQYQKSDLVQRVRRAVEVALREKRISLDESGRLMQRYEQGLSGYTYLTATADEPAAAAAAAATLGNGGALRALNPATSAAPSNGAGTLAALPAGRVSEK